MFRRYSLVVVVVISYAFLSARGTFAFDYFQPLPDRPIAPADNPQSPEKILLGKKLFFDKSLSRSHSHSCNECHNLFSGGDNDLAFADGTDGKPSKRSAPGLWNIGYQSVLYWDGRSGSLEQQAVDHISDPSITGYKDTKFFVQTVESNKEYKALFSQAFKNNSITLELIAKALASFQRELIAANSPFDRYMRGNKDALTQAAIKGMQLFNDIGCVACHFGVNFAGPAPGPALGMGDGFYELFPNYKGTAYDSTHELLQDLGRFEFSKHPGEKHMWRVPPLRNIALTAPYFHNGSAKTLREAVTIMAKTQFNKEVTSEQTDFIVAFLNSLTGELPPVIAVDNNP